MRMRTLLPVFIGSYHDMDSASLYTPCCDVTDACMKGRIWKWVMASYCAARCCTRMRWFRSNRHAPFQHHIHPVLLNHTYCS